jgi:Family of unknown function (DUF6714)
MDTPLQIRSAVEDEIRTAFRGVTLEQGMSIRRAQLADHFQDAVLNEHSATNTSGEITDDWSHVSLSELERDGIAHLDALGFRYYIPAHRKSKKRQFYSLLSPQRVDGFGYREGKSDTPGFGGTVGVFELTVPLMAVQCYSDTLCRAFGVSGTPS